MRALDEDAPGGDLTASLVIPVDARCRAEIRAKADGVIAGVRAAQAVFDVVSEQDDAGRTQVRWKVRDGDQAGTGDLLATLEGPARSILRGERVAINLLAHLSGVATLTSRYVRAAAPARILCTRKTLPGLRGLEREAVLAGGGTLHRASLSDAVLIKDNHLRIVGGVAEAVRRAKEGGVAVEVEVETLDQLGDLETVQSLVTAGARVISVGRITHSAPSLDLSLEVTDVG